MIRDRPIEVVEDEWCREWSLLTDVRRPRRSSLFFRGGAVDTRGTSHGRSRCNCTGFEKKYRSKDADEIPPPCRGAHPCLLPMAAGEATPDGSSSIDLLAVRGQGMAEDMRGCKHRVTGIASRGNFAASNYYPPVS